MNSRSQSHDRAASSNRFRGGGGGGVHSTYINSTKAMNNYLAVPLRGQRGGGGGGGVEPLYERFFMFENLFHMY